MKIIANHRLSSRPLILSLLLLILSYGSSLSQVVIKGPGCVVPEVKYLYIIKGDWDSLSTFSLCINGGSLADNGDSCYRGKPLTFIKVIWQEQVAAGTISINSSLGSASWSVHLTSPLEPGAISPGTAKQVVDYSRIPALITCSPATGGGCTPSYEYQWQQSSNSLEWVNMNNATGRDLKLISPLPAACYFRRKVTETASGSIRYSDAAVVYVNPPINPNSSAARNNGSGTGK